MGEPPSPPSSTSRWWLLWLGNVLGCPLVVHAAATKLGERAFDLGISLGLIVLAALVLHLHFSIRLARQVAAGRSHATQQKDAGGLLSALLIGGAAVMIALAFMGCMVPALNARFTREYRNMEQQQRIKDRQKPLEGAP